MARPGPDEELLQRHQRQGEERRRRRECTTAAGCSRRKLLAHDDRILAPPIATLVIVAAAPDRRKAEFAHRGRARQRWKRRLRGTARARPCCRECRRLHRSAARRCPAAAHPGLVPMVMISASSAARAQKQKAQRLGRVAATSADRAGHGQKPRQIGWRSRLCRNSRHGGSARRAASSHGRPMSTARARRLWHRIRPR